MGTALGYFAGNLDPVFPVHSNHIPKITWDVNTLEFGMPLVECQRYSEPDPENESVDTQDGFKDGWQVGFNQFLRAYAQYIPAGDETTIYGVPVTGWYGATGWRSFIIWAMAQRTFSFYPNRLTSDFYTCYLISPYGEKAERSWAFSKRLQLVLSTADQSQFLGY